MFVVQALHPDGWRPVGRSGLEYWAYQEARIRCCSDGRHYRIIDEATGIIVAMLTNESCQRLERHQSRLTAPKSALSC